MNDAAVGHEHRRIGQPLLHQLKGEQSVVHRGKFLAAELNHVDLDALDGEVVEQGVDDGLGVPVQVHRRVDEVHAQDANGLRLLEAVAVPHRDVQEDIARFGTGLALKPDAHPTVGLVLPLETLGGHGGGEGEELGGRTALAFEAFDQEWVLMIEHRDQTLAAHIPIALAINRVTHRHVVRGDGLGDGAAGSADPEKPPRNLLTGANLGKNAVLGRVEVDLKGLLVGIELVAHSLSPIENRIWPARNLGETGTTPKFDRLLHVHRHGRTLPSAMGTGSRPIGANHKPAANPRPRQEPYSTPRRGSCPRPASPKSVSALSAVGDVC